MDSQLTIEKLHAKLGALLRDGADPDTPILTKQYEEGGSFYERVASLEIEYVSAFDYRLKEDVTRDSMILE